MSAQQASDRIKELESLQSQIRGWRTVAAIAVIIIVVTTVMTILNSVKVLTIPGPERDVFTEHFQQGFTEEVMPQVRLAAGMALQELTPVVKEELVKLDAQSPRVMEAVEQELATMQTSLPDRAEKVLETTIGQMLRARESKVREMYPDLTDAKVSEVVENLIEESRNRSVKVMDDLFRPHQDMLGNILDNLNTIEKLERPHIRGQKPTWDMAILLLDVIKEDLAGLDSADFHETTP